MFDLGVLLNALSIVAPLRAREIVDDKNDMLPFFMANNIAVVEDVLVQVDAH